MPTEDPIAFLQRLCEVDSRTIDGAAGTTHVAEMLGERLEELGFALEWHDTLPEEGPRGRHLKAVRNPDADSHLVLIGHTDTVLSPADVPFRHDEPTQTLYGSGVCDMKGGNVIMLAAIEHALAACPDAAKMGMVVLFNCTEEISGPSFHKLARDATRGATACLSFEPARPDADRRHQIVVARKGVTRFELVVRGRGAHSGNSHEQGVNAIREAARKVEQLADLTDYDRDLTVNVGIIQGGKAANQVPDEARVTFGVRAYDRETLDDACQRIRAICDQPTVTSPADGATTSLTLSGFESYPPWPRQPEAEALAARYIELAGNHGITATPIQTGGGADVSHVADLAPALDGLGALVDRMHSTEEWADAATFTTRARAAADLLASLCTDGAPRDASSQAAAPGSK